MTTKVTTEQALGILHTSISNAISTGYMSGYGLDLQYSEEEYKQSKKALKNPCWEDVLIQILKDGGSLIIVGEEGSEEPVSVTLNDVEKRTAEMPIRLLSTFLEEEDDANTADEYLQLLFFGEQIYG